MSTSFSTDEIDRDYLNISGASTTRSKTFTVNGWNQKMILIKADQQVVLTIMYTLITQIAPQDSYFFPLSTAKNVTLLANEIIPFGVEDPIQFLQVEVTTTGPAVVEILALGSR